MRKWIVLLLVLLVTVLGVFYLSTPKKSFFRQQEQISFSSKAFSRALFDEATWQRWWPGDEKNETGFRYNGNSYFIKEKKLSSFLINICNEKDTLVTELVFIALTADSVELEWLGADKLSGNTFQRIQKNNWMKEVASDAKILLQEMKRFYTQVDNLYPIIIREEKVVDSILISTSATVDRYPSPALIYTLLEKLNAYAVQKGAWQTGLPMLNITEKTNEGYLTKVALPVNKKLPDTNDIQYRWMLGGGNILVTEVRGGPHTIQQAFTTMEQYADDFNRVAPAIPFQSLITDRRVEADTAKWLTKVYWPVM
jgi:hypothetical protein